MTQETKTTTSTGVSFSSLLGLLFIGLKLGGVINWSWWWVLSPFWIPLAIALTVLAGIGLFLLFKYKKTQRSYTKTFRIKKS